MSIIRTEGVQARRVSRKRFHSEIDPPYQILTMCFALRHDLGKDAEEIPEFQI